MLLICFTSVKNLVGPTNGETLENTALNELDYQKQAPPYLFQSPPLISHTSHCFWPRNRERN